MIDIEIIHDPIRREFSRAEIIEKMNEWMFEKMGNPMNLDHDQRNQWYRDNGIICAFLRDTFPVDKQSTTSILDKIRSGTSLAQMIEESRVGQSQ